MSTVLTEPRRENLAAQFRASTWNEEDRTMDIVWYTGATVLRSRWFSDPYELTFEMSDEAADLSRLNKGAPILMDHRQNLQSQIGKVVEGSARIENGKGIATIKFSSQERFAGIVKDIVDGVISNWSMGASILQRRIDERKDTYDLHTATKWSVLEISSLPVPADPDATNLNNADDPQPEPPMSTPTNPTTPVDEAALRAQIRKEVEAKLKADVRKEVEAEVKADVRKEVEAEVKAGVREEVATELAARREDVMTKAGLLGLSNEQTTELLSDASLVGDKLTAKLFELAADTEDKRGISPRIALRGNNDAAWTENLSNAILLRQQVISEDKAGEGALAFVVDDFIGLAKLCLEREGVSLASLNKSRIAERAIVHLAQHSTSDFSNILSNSANKAALEGYNETPRTFLDLGRRRDLRDFKTFTANRLGAMSSLLEVKEGEEYVKGTMGEQAETWSLVKNGRIFEITYEALVNDDLGVFTDTPFEAGELAARRESDMAWDKIAGTDTMSDSKTIFHADHNNLIASGAPPSTASELKDTMLKLRQQTGIGGETIQLMPRVVVVPTGLFFGLEQLLGGMYLPTSAASGVTPRMRQLQIRDEIRLDSKDSGNAWYIFAGPRQSGFEYGYLQGEPGVRVIRSLQNSSDGVQFIVRNIFGVGVVDYRGMVKNAGA